MAGAAGGAGDSPIDRAGVCVQRVQDSAVAVDWREQTGGGGLEADADRVDLFVGDRDAGVVGGGVWEWLEGAGPRKAMFVSAVCFALGFYISYFGVITHQLWLLYLGYGFVGGIGLGLGYISPVSTLIKWFPDRPGLATGMAIMGFGGGAMIGAPLSIKLMAFFKTAGDRRRRKNVPGDGDDLFHLHDVWRVYDSCAARRVEAGGMDGASEGERDDHDAQRRCEYGVWDAAVLAVVGGVVHERDGGDRDYRAGFADDSGIFQGRDWAGGGGRICRAAESVQHGGTIFLVVGVGLPRAEDDVFHLFCAGSGAVFLFAADRRESFELDGVVCGDGGDFAEHVWRGVCDDSGVFAGYVWGVSRERDSWAAC